MPDQAAGVPHLRSLPLSPSARRGAEVDDRTPESRWAADAEDRPRPTRTRVEPARPTSVLIICTANRCRSPLAAALLDQQARQRGLALDVTSAGLLPGGQPVPAEGVRVGAELGLDLRSHRSRTVTTADLTAADLVVTMTREHARTLVAQEPQLWPRVFTLGRLPDWLEQQLAVDPPPRRADLRSWLDAAAADRNRRELLGRAPDEDVIDPFRQPLAVWYEVSARIRSLTSATLDLSLPLLRPLTG